MSARRLAAGNVSGYPQAEGGGIGLSGPARDGYLTIRGGAGGIAVQLEELTGGAEKLDSLAADLLAAETEVGRIGEQLGMIAGAAPWSAAPHVAAVRNSQWSLRLVRQEMQQLSTRIRDCRREYELAEWRADAVRFLGFAGVADIRGSMATMAGTGVPDRSSVEGLVSTLGLESADTRRRIARAPQLRDLLMGFLRPRPLQLRQEETLSVALDSSPAGLLERVRLIDARGAGFIEILAVGAGPARTYVVVVPGTQAAGSRMGGENPFDEAGIAEGMFYGSAEIDAAILSALRAAGAEPGASVVAVGYSQGGIHAMNLVADPRIRHEYNVGYVLTAGSPVAGINAPPGVGSLHLEHRADWVPGADGTPNPDTRDRVTVTLGSPPVAGPGEGGLGAGHSLSGYENGARLVAASSDPSLVSTTAALGVLLGAGGSATATRFQLTRSRELPRRAPATEPRSRERGLGGR